MSWTPAADVAAPPFVPTSGGLFSTFTFRSNSADRWEPGGVTFDTIGCDTVASRSGDGCDTDGLGAELDAGLSVCANGEATPFTVYGQHRASPVANTEANNFQLAETKLLRHEEKGVERAIATGALGNTPSFKDATELTTGPVSLAVGLGLLEEFLAAEYGGQGVIHMPRLPAAAAGANLTRTVATLRTLLGTPVAAGAGYSGVSPTGAAATGSQRWIYVTPPLFGYRSDVFSRMSPIFDPRDNTRFAIAERTYLIGWEDCGVAAVLVDAAAGTTGGGSGNIAVTSNGDGTLTIST